MAKLIGLMRLGADAEVRTVGEQKVANLRVVYNYGQKGADGKRPSQWIDAALWGKRAESLAQYLKKGTQHLFVIDDVHMASYTDKDGYEAFKMAGIVSDIELGSNERSEGASSAPAASSAPPQRRPAAEPQRQAPAPRQSLPDEDDIPF